MLRVEFFGAAVVFAVLCCATVVYAFGAGERPLFGLIMAIMAIVTAASWGAISARHTRQQLRDMRRELQNLQVERDVDQAITTLRPHLRVVHRDS